MATFYQTTLIQSRSISEFPYIKVREFLYRFKTESRHTYFIVVEEYINHLFAVKFYAKDHRLSPNKFKLLTNSNTPKETRSIILTCIHTGFNLLKDYPDYSFAFIGCPKYNSDEDFRNNQRFRIYCRIVTTFISGKNFRYYSDTEYSTCLLINERELARNPQLFNVYQQMYYDHIVSFLE